MTKEEFELLFGSDKFKDLLLKAKEIQRKAYPDYALQGKVKEDYLSRTEPSLSLLLAVLIKEHQE